MGMTQATVADLCGTGFQQIQKYETGAAAMSAARLWRVACALDVPVTYFCEGQAAAAAEPPSFLPNASDVTDAFARLGDAQRQAILDLVVSMTAAKTGQPTT